MEYVDHREKLLDFIQQGCRDGLIRLSAGNFSTRINNELVAITPSNILYRNLKVEDISIINLDGGRVDGPVPSSETPLHSTIYRTIARAQSICHTHSVYAMVCSMLGEEIPLISLELMACGAPIPTIPWAAPGTAQAGLIATEALKSREDLNVILLRQHGLVAIGGTLDEAYNRAYNAEIGLEVYYKVLLAGNPQPFTAHQVSEIRKVYKL